MNVCLKFEVKPLKYDKQDQQRKAALNEQKYKS
jgi:hypothetical protein